ncbi:MAG: putative endonuclease [Vicingaceae bacterium]|jgi:putative endonuclease
MAKDFHFYVYILKCSDNSYYTRVTNNVELRIKQHNEGINLTSYTHSRRPVELVFLNEFKYIDKAIAFEKQLKGWSKRKKEAIIKSNWDDLKEHAICKNEGSTKAKGYKRDKDWEG